VSGAAARAAAPSIHAVGLAAAGAFLLAAARVLPLDAPPLSLFGCPFRAATGLPCLSCGCTHAFAAVVRFDLAGAASANPLGALVAIACVVHCALTALRLCGLRWVPQLPPLGASRARELRLCAATLLAANWAFVAVRGAP
jgi:hypothetical protein